MDLLGSQACTRIKSNYELWANFSIFNDVKVKIFLEQREVAFLSPSKICENLNFSRETQIFANLAGW